MQISFREVRNRLSLAPLPPLPSLCLFPVVILGRPDNWKVRCIARCSVILLRCNAATTSANASAKLSRQLPSRQKKSAKMIFANLWGLWWFGEAREEELLPPFSSLPKYKIKLLFYIFTRVSVGYSSLNLEPNCPFTYSYRQYV